MELMIAEVFFKAAVLCSILYAFARHEADYSFQKVAMVVAGITAGDILIAGVVTPHLGPWTLLVNLAFSAFMLVTFCWISPAKSLLVVSLFCGFEIAMALGIGALQKKLLASMDEPAVQTRQRELEEMKQEIIKDMDAQTSPASPPVELEPDPAPESAAVPEPPPPLLSAPVAPPPAAETTAPATEPPPPPPTSGDWAAARLRIKIGGIVSGGVNPVAQVNGRTVEVGHTFETTFSNRVYRWKVNSIEKGRVDLQPAGSTEQRPPGPGPAHSSRN
jgi:hypothetical protein